jgi:hypothetical protein
MSLCSFGCGQQAIKQFKSGSFCCSNFVGSCPAHKIKTGAGVKLSISKFENPNDRWKNGHPRGQLGKISLFRGKSLEEIHGSEKADIILQKLRGRDHVGTPHTQKMKDHLSEIAKERKLGGYVEGSGRGKKGRYKGIWCDSSWELAWVMYHLDHGVYFVRNTKKFEYHHDEKIRKWIPDFIMSDGSYVEIKGYMTEQAKAKIDSFSLPLNVINKVDIQPFLEYATNTYGKDFLKLYD